jgi:transposase-like protein
MAKPDKREEAERLYVRQSMSCAEVSEQLGIDSGSVYRWKNEAAAKGEALDWDSQRRVYNMSPKELMAIYAESVKSWILQLKADPKLLSDPKIADAISKHISVMQKLDTRGQYLGVAIDLIKVINVWLDKHQPDLKKKMEPFWDDIYASLKEYTTNKGVL